jgi:hypothetical protein
MFQKETKSDMKKFQEFISEDYTAVGYTGEYPNYSISSSVPTTGYSMQPVVFQMNETANNLAEEAFSYHNNEDESHTGEGYMKEALKELHNRINEAYHNKLGSKLPLVNDVFDPRFKGSDVADY